MLWKIYFWFLLAFTGLAIIVGAFEANGLFTNIFDALNIVFVLIGLIGVYGYAFEKNVGSRNIWLVITVVTLLYQLAYSFILDQKYGAAPVNSAIDGLVTFVPIIPMYIGLLFYVFRKK